jgi:hypothetical protein
MKGFVAMIIREIKDSFIMIRQHDHAQLSGEVIKHFSRDLLSSELFFEDLLVAAYQHDRGWIGLDHTPIWNDRLKRPYSFSDFPLIPKLAFYKKGLDEIEEMNSYAGLLCSMHFCSFFSQSKDKNGVKFLEDEAIRQNRIKMKLSGINESLLHQHFHLLQFSDNLSLYFCLNEPGTEKNDEHPWFKSGFKNTESFHPGKGRLNAFWKNAHEISVTSFPFANDFHINLQFKEVSKKAVEAQGIAEAYKKSKMKQQTFSILEE